MSTKSYLFVEKVLKNLKIVRLSEILRNQWESFQTIWALLCHQDLVRTVFGQCIVLLFKFINSLLFFLSSYRVSLTSTYYFLPKLDPSTPKSSDVSFDGSHVADQQQQVQQLPQQQQQQQTSKIPRFIRNSSRSHSSGIYLWEVHVKMIITLTKLNWFEMLIMTKYLVR